MPNTKSSFAFLHKNTIYQLITPFDCKPQHSFSAILAASNCLIQYFPEIYPPLEQQQKEQIKSHIKEYYNPLIEYWNDYLAECTVNGMAILYQDTFYILIPLDYLPTLQLKDHPLLAQRQIQQLWGQAEYRQLLAQIFSIPFQQVKQQKKIGIYLTHPLNEQKYQPRINMSPIFIGLLFNNQKWQTFDITKGQIPQANKIQSFDSIIITGSEYSVLSQSQQISLGLDRLMTAYNSSNKLKIVGVCYGHQLLSLYFGAKVVKKTMKSELQTIHFDQKIVEKYSFLQNIQTSLPLQQTQLHQDYVQSIPQSFQHLARSQSCEVQALISKNGRILTTQFHSQLLYNYCKDIDKCLEYYGDSFNFKSDESNQIIEKNIDDSLIFLEVIRRFIDC